MLITSPAALTFIAGVIMMSPVTHRRAAGSGISGNIIVPGLIAMLGTALFSDGIYIRNTGS